MKCCGDIYLDEEERDVFLSIFITLTNDYRYLGCKKPEEIKDIIADSRCVITWKDPVICPYGREVYETEQCLIASYIYELLKNRENSNYLEKLNNIHKLARRHVKLEITINGVEYEALKYMAEMFQVRPERFVEYAVGKIKIPE